MKPPTLRSFALIIEGILFTIIVPGTVTVAIPLLILEGSILNTTASWDVWQYTAVSITGVGSIVYIWCLWDFITRGRGIPLPIDHPKQLVVHGLYRYVRNPMYLGVLCILLGEVIFFQSGLLLLYTLGWFVVIQGVVLMYEEPTLRKKFGDGYDQYKQSVRRWLPGKRYGDKPVRMTRFQIGFGLLVIAQAAHSIEEYVGHLWESFPPAEYLTRLISSDLQVGFIVINGSLVAFGIWCFLWPVRLRWQSAAGLAWFWIGIELINGIGHPLWSLSQIRYTPGLATAPLLLVIALYLAIQLSSSTQKTVA